MIPDDGTPVRRASIVTDGDLPARLLAFLEDRAAPPGPAEDEAPAVAVDPGLVARLRAAHAEALPGRLAAITGAARAGDARALAADAGALAGSSAQLGDPDVARLSGAIAAQARRGVVAAALVAELTEAAGAVPVPRGGQATRR
ncbi:hypothetical protein SAMN05660657_03226 [Geodermatophilus amargosae]|uniref:Uncharacterized protein n=1 Tax=Geodermatophilus amargosae TaxID=1296565 RepID=A0A1I7B0Z9_9ACTN|nr:hypothetical protein [Geodermatophilus amargosae]SFT80873.1 hypothetical protein SAMN05660657_03226 [Geodermatophilus amargosae]